MQFKYTVVMCARPIAIKGDALHLITNYEVLWRIRDIGNKARLPVVFSSQETAKECCDKLNANRI